MTESLIPDVQGAPDARQIPITRVGVREVRIPIVFENADGTRQHSVATAEMTVALPEEKKGTHMSRFVEILNQTEVYRLAELPEAHRAMLKRLDAKEGTFLLNFPYFVEKTAPVSGSKSFMDYEVTLMTDGGEDCEVQVEVTVPVTSLCPCSKEISQYGAHNQRSHIIISALYSPDAPFAIEELIQMGEEGASCPLWALLKRPDEKYVTERAYENPKFVEDIVRDVAILLNRDARILAYSVSSENFESIHNHSACALIEHDKRL